MLISAGKVNGVIIVPNKKGSVLPVFSYLLDSVELHQTDGTTFIGRRARERRRVVLDDYQILLIVPVIVEVVGIERAIIKIDEVSIKRMLR